MKMIVFAASTMLALAACQAPSGQNNDAEWRSDVGTNDANVATPGMATQADDQTGTEAVDGRTSRYTSLGKDNCKLIEESDEGPYWRIRCGGDGGFTVDYTESDLRQGIELIDAAGKRTSLEIPSKVAVGAFDRLGPQIEWRGDRNGKRDSLIVRVYVAQDSGEQDKPVLAVARLAPVPCVIGIVEPGANQNARARALADAEGRCI